MSERWYYSPENQEDWSYFARITGCSIELTRQFIFNSRNEVCKQTICRNAKRDTGCRETRPMWPHRSNSIVGLTQMEFVEFCSNAELPMCRIKWVDLAQWKVRHLNRATLCGIWLIKKTAPWFRFICDLSCTLWRHFAWLGWTSSFYSVVSERVFFLFWSKNWIKCYANITVGLVYLDTAFVLVTL